MRGRTGSTTEEPTAAAPRLNVPKQSSKKQRYCMTEAEIRVIGFQALERRREALYVVDTRAVRLLPKRAAGKSDMPDMI